VNDYKRRVYRENRLDLIEIYPSDFKDSWQDKINSGIYKTLDSRVRDYLSRMQFIPWNALPLLVRNGRQPESIPMESKPLMIHHFNG